MKAIPNNMGATARSGLAGGEVKYMTNDELTPLSNAQYEFSASLEDLGKKDDWGIQFEGCNTVRWAIAHHDIINTSNIPVLTPELLKIADSLRSSLSKIALITLEEMFLTQSKRMDS